MPFTVYADLILADGATCYLPLDADTLDYAPGSSHNGTLSGSPLPAPTTGPFGGYGAYTFVPHPFGFTTPAGSWIALATPATLPGGQDGDFSWEGWIRLADDGFNGAGLVGSPYGWLTLSGTSFNVFAWAYAGPPHSTFVWGPLTPHRFGQEFHNLDGAPSYTGDVTPDARAWHHIVATSEAGIFPLRGRIYIDGVLVSTQTNNSTWGLYAGTPYAGALGGITATSGGQIPVGEWSGDLAQVALYPYALTPCQVKAHYDLALTGSYTPCNTIRRAQVQIIDGWQRTGVIHDGGTPASALVTEGGDPLTVPTITP